MRILVDECDLALLQSRPWFAVVRDSGKTYIQDSAGKLLHRLIMGEPVGDVDHVNGDTYDNRRENLRCATRAQNMANARIRVDNVSGFKGVSFHVRKQRWFGRVKVNGVSHQGPYVGDAATADAWCREARKRLHGEFARDK